MSRKGSLDCHVRSLLIPDFSNKNDVRGLPKHRPNNPRKIQADIMPHLNLVNPRQVILNRVLGGDDLAVRTIQVVHRGVQRGGFAAAGRARHEKNPVRTPYDRLKTLIIVVAETELPNAYLDIFFVQNPHHDGLAVRRRQDAYPHIDLFATDDHLNPTVLRSAFFGNIHPGHDLDARNHRPVQPPSRILALDTYSVDSVPHPNPVLKGLDVNIAGPHVHRFLDDQLHQADDRGIVLSDRGDIL